MMNQSLSATDTMSRSRFPDGFRILKGSREYVTYIEHSSLRVWFDDEPKAYQNHYHSAVEIIMPMTGEVVYTISDFSYRVQPGEVLIIPPNWEHSQAIEGPFERFLFLFEPDSIFSMRDMPLIDRLLRIPIYLSDQQELQDGARALLTEVAACYRQREFLWNTKCYSYLMQLYVLLGQQNATSDMVMPGVKLRHSDHEIVESARLYIDQYYMREMTLSDVSAFTGYSQSYFSRIFKQQIGTSFSEYLRVKRVSAAADMLIHTRESVQDIAVKAGFGSIATFNRVFHEVKQCTPTRFRDIYGDLTASEKAQSTEE